MLLCWRLDLTRMLIYKKSNLINEFEDFKHKVPLSIVLLLSLSLSLIPQSLSSSVRCAIDERLLFPPSPGPLQKINSLIWTQSVICLGTFFHHLFILRVSSPLDSLDWGLTRWERLPLTLMRDLFRTCRTNISTLLMTWSFWSRKGVIYDRVQKVPFKNWHGIFR